MADIDLTENGFLVNGNAVYKNTDAIDTFIEPHVFLNKLIRRKYELEVGATTIEIDARYDFRPDRLAFEQYGQDFWYPALLIVNNIGSMLQFKAEQLNFQCKIPSATTIANILNSADAVTTTPEDIVNTVFKTN